MELAGSGHRSVEPPMALFSSPGTCFFDLTPWSHPISAGFDPIDMVESGSC